MGVFRRHTVAQEGSARPSDTVALEPTCFKSVPVCLTAKERMNMDHKAGPSLYHLNKMFSSQAKARWSPPSFRRL